MVWTEFLTADSCLLDPSGHNLSGLWFVEFPQAVSVAGGSWHRLMSDSPLSQLVPRCTGVMHSTVFPLSPSQESLNL